MADPFGIVGVIGLTIQISQAVVRIGVDWKDTPDNIKAFMAELGTLKTVLSETHANLLLNSDFEAAFRNRPSLLLSQLGSNGSNTNTKLMLDLCQEKLEALLKELTKRRQGHKLGWGRLKGAFLAKDTRDSVENLSRHCQTLNYMLSIDTTVLAASTHKEVSEARKEHQEWRQADTKTFSAIQSSVDQSRWWQQNEKHRAILNWLTPIDYAPQQHDFISRRQSGTGQWLLDAAEFQDWLGVKKKTLFCPGIPGAGKTILTAIVIDDLTTRFANDLTAGVAYVYCNFRRQDEQKIADLFANLLKQLTLGMASPLAKVTSLYDKHMNKRSRPSIDEILKTLQDVAATYSRIFIIIDGLDEYRGSDGCRTEFLSKIFELQAKCQANIFATSRFNSEIDKKFKSSMRLEIRASEEDVRRYLDGHLLWLPEFARDKPELEREIKAEIIKAVDGMFLLAQLHLNSLKGKNSPKAIRTALKKLPTGSEAYDFAYQDAMERIECQLPDQGELAKQVLSWITCAKRPLTTSELEHALAVEAGETQLDIDNLCRVEDMVSVCTGLVTVDEESGIVRLVHYTAQEYFARTKDKWFPDAETNITVTCVTYLSFSLFKSGFCCTDAEFEERLQVNRLYDYAAKNWGHHARLASISYRKVADFIECEPKLEASTQAMVASQPYPQYSGYSKHFPRQMTGLHLAACFGIQEAVKALIDQGNLDIQDSYGRAPLFLAADNGHAMVVKLLLEKKANVNAEGSSRVNALQTASYNGNEAIVKLLLENNADVNAQGGSWGNALKAASYNGNEAIVRLLLENKADVNAQGGTWGNALQAASAKGHKAIVKLLLENKADVNAQKGYHGNALQAASVKGHEAIVKLLLENKADVNAQGGYYGNALQAASYNSNKAIVKLLLENKADVNAQGGTWGNALQAASVEGHETIVKLLFENKADVNAQGGSLGNALEAASAGGHEAIVKLLLKNEADVNAQGGYYGNALQAASVKGHEATVRLLLESKADINAQGGYYSNALQAASVKGHEAIVKLLLENKADVNAQGGYHNNALQAASYNGHEAIVKLLLENKADVNAQWGTWGNALRVASAEGHEAIVKLLLENKADINAQGGIHGNALQAASARGHKAIVKLLLENKANVALSPISGK